MLHRTLRNVALDPKPWKWQHAGPAAVLAALLALVGLACEEGGGDQDDDTADDDAADDDTADDDTADDDTADDDTADDDTAAPGAYGIFQLYGDEYKLFREQMGFSLEDYWDFVDGHVAELGVSFTRTNTLLIWELIEPKIGAGYFFDNIQLTDQVIAATYAEAEGKQMDMLLVFDPHHTDFAGSAYPAGFEEQYQDFVRAVVERYDGDGTDDVNGDVRVKHWQVMNEPFWFPDAEPLTAESYADLVILTAEAVHDADPEGAIVLGEVDMELGAILAHLEGQVEIAAVDRHFWSTLPGYQDSHVPAIRNLLDDHGFEDASIWMCEFGTYVHAPGGNPEQSEGDQARWLIQAMVANRAQGVSRILWNNLVAWTDFAGSPDSIFNFMGLISSGEDSGDTSNDLGRERIAYHAYQRLVQETEIHLSTAPDELAGLPQAVRVFQFETTASGDPFFVAWSDGDAIPVDLPCETAQADVTVLIPDAAGVFTETATACAGGTVTIDLDADPVLVQPSD